MSKKGDDKFSSQDNNTSGTPIEKHPANPASSKENLKNPLELIPNNKHWSNQIQIEHGFTPNPEAHLYQQEMKKLQFLNVYVKVKNPAVVCGSLGIPRRTFYAWLEQDKRFKEAFDHVNWITIGFLATEATKRAEDGSDHLLEFLLKAYDPVYREKVSAELEKTEIDRIVVTLVDALRSNIPDTCPHCKSNLNLSSKVEMMLQSLTRDGNAK
jgi:hypothetical protein